MSFVSALACLVLKGAPQESSILYFFKSICLVISVYFTQYIFVYDIASQAWTCQNFREMSEKLEKLASGNAVQLS